MNDSESFSNSIYVDQAHLAERELSAFIGAVTELFGAEQARASTEDWLEEAELMDSPPLSINRDWRSVTIAASADWQIGSMPRSVVRRLSLPRLLLEYRQYHRPIVSLPLFRFDVLIEADALEENPCR